ncbi:MAG: nuclear transport factor 2 family protein [Sphingobacterium sp.]|jgi:hypothetical protein|nr:nuclear transport factor 2 family protein [Sphingobacterium sp.]
MFSHFSDRDNACKNIRSSSPDIIEESADYMVAEVTLKFEDFTKTDLFTLERVGNDWKVSKSINSYK